MDITDYAALDTEIPLESVLGDVQNEEILCSVDTTDYRGRLCLVALALHLPAFFAVCIALLAIIAFSGATHDVATDGVYMSELNKQDQAKYIGWQGAFYNIAKIVASGGLVWLAGWLLKHYGEFREQRRLFVMKPLCRLG